VAAGAISGALGAKIVVRGQRNAPAGFLVLPGRFPAMVAGSIIAG